MQLSQCLLYFSLLSSAVIARPQDSPNDDEDDALPSCAAGCSNALSSSALAQGANTGNLWPNACQNADIISAFNACRLGAACSDDDREGAGDWIHSTCNVVARTASATVTTRPASTTTGSSSSSATTTNTASTTSTSSATTTTTTATPSATSSPDTGLSTGAKAGIGVGVALGVLLLAAAIAAFCIQRMRRSRRDSQQLWPNNVDGWEQVKGNGSGSDAGGMGGAAAAGAAGAAAATRGMSENPSRYEPQDPYSAWRPHPDQPELSDAAARHELHGQHFTPWNELHAPDGESARGVNGANSSLPASLAIGGTAAATASGLKYVSELDGTGITRAGLARKPVNPLHFFDQSQGQGQTQDGEDDDEEERGGHESHSGLLSATTGTTIERPISSISNASNDDGERVGDAADVPLPRSPVSPSSPTMRAWQG